jgi:hypothetical protein
VRLPGTHLHLFREGYEDKWAFPIDATCFTNIADIETSFQDFCAYCHIHSVPSFQASIP